MTKAWRKKPDTFVRAEDIEQVVTDEVEGKIVRNTDIGGVILPMVVVPEKARYQCQTRKKNSTTNSERLRISRKLRSLLCCSYTEKC